MRFFEKIKKGFKKNKLASNNKKLFPAFAIYFSYDL
jgi:hypothetical protein